MTLPITAIIVTYYSDAVLPQCVASLTEIEKILVVDNGGTLKPEGVIFLRNRKNLGFGRAINRGLSQVTTPYVLLINPDAALPPGALQTMLDILIEHPTAALTAPVLLDEDGNHRRSWRVNGEKKPDHTPPDAFSVDYNPAAVWLMRTEALRNIGGFDRKFFLFYEDQDVCLRLVKAGYSIIIEPEVVATHLQGKSSPPSLRTQYIKHTFTTRSDLYFTQKHYGLSAMYRRALKLAINNTGRLLIGIITLNSEKIIAAIARLIGLLSFLYKGR